MNFNAPVFELPKRPHVSTAGSLGETEGSAEKGNGDMANAADVADEHDNSLKLFIGQIPRTMEAEELKGILEEYGEIVNIVIIRDRATGAHRGCAFVTFAEAEQAYVAVEKLHNIVTLPGSQNPLQARPADGQQGASQENKLFVGMIPKTSHEDSIRDVFAPFGAIEEVYILRHASTQQSKGCAFLKFKQRDAANAAIEQLNGKYTMEGGISPLVVKFADSRRQRLQRQRHQIQDSATTAYWQMPPGTALSFPQLQLMQQQYMQQIQAMGIQSHEVNAASYGYYNPYYAGYGYIEGTPSFSTDFQYQEVDLMLPVLPASVSVQGDLVDASQLEGDLRSAGQTEGPEGANLFIYHLPHDLTDADLATAFAPFGTVLSAKVYTDKNTGESKGFGFVSYDACQAADAAIESMNGFQIGSKRLKVQHKRIHLRDDYYDDVNSSHESFDSTGAPGDNFIEDASEGIENLQLSG